MSRLSVQPAEPLRAELEPLAKPLTKGEKPSVEGDEVVRGLHLAHLIARSWGDWAASEVDSKQEHR